jgi:hypothetical protein
MDDELILIQNDTELFVANISVKACIDIAQQHFSLQKAQYFIFQFANSFLKFYKVAQNF